jgi:hypothetical protein
MKYDSSDDKMRARAAQDSEFREWLETLNRPIAAVNQDAEWNHVAESDQWMRMTDKI